MSTLWSRRTAACRCASHPPGLDLPDGPPVSDTHGAAEAASLESPIPDWAPFVRLGEGERRELARRRYLLSSLRALAELARAERLPAASVEIEEVALRLRRILFAQPEAGDRAGDDLSLHAGL